jgi:hypothetical protein
VQFAATPTTKPAATQPEDENKLMWACWDDLAKDEPWPTRAVLDLYDRPRQGVKFLRDRLQPLKISQSDLDAAINDLGSSDEKIWRPAFEKLEYLDPRLTKSSHDLLQDLTDTTARSRLSALFTGSAPEQWIDYDVSCGPTDNGNTTLYFNKAGNIRTNVTVQENPGDFGQSKSQWNRADHAIVLLQHIGSPEAIAIIRDMASGDPRAQPTTVAKLALRSLGEPLN